MHGPGIEEIVFRSGEGGAAVSGSHKGLVFHSGFDLTEGIQLRRGIRGGYGNEGYDNIGCEIQVSYADKSGELRVGFISNNDITGGNSGSPVLNGRGELIGLAFDGNWEAMSGDIAFEPELQRTISVDIRYVLFVVDKFAGAGHLVDEMTIVK